MTHAFKLAKRIARNRTAALLLTLGAFGCAVDQVVSVQSTADSLGTSNGQDAGHHSRISAAAVTSLFVEGFEDSNLASRQWYDIGSMTTSSTERVVGTRSLEARFSAGSVKPSWGVARRQFTPSESITLSYWVKYSSNWQGSANGSQPHEFSLLTTEDSKWVGPGSTRLTFSMQHASASSALTPLFAWHDRTNIDQTRIGQNLIGITELRAVSGCNGHLIRPGISVTCYNIGGGKSANLSTLLAGQAALRRNVWQRVELFVQLNTIQNGIGQANGVLTYSVDGELVMDRRDLMFRTGARPNMKFQQLFLAPYLPSGASATQFVWYDDLQVSTGAAEASPPPPPIVAVASVVVTPGSNSRSPGQTVQLTATPQDAAGNALTGRVITWTSAAPSVATVSANGMVTAVAPGSATITATSEGRSGSATVTVAAAVIPVASVLVAPTTLNLPVGQTGQVTATPRDASGNSLSGRVVTWSSSAPAIATVNSSGLVTGVALGSATITATSEGQSAAASATVVPVPVASVVVAPVSLSLQVGQTGQIAATPRDAGGNSLSGRVVTWSSSAPGIATVNSSGLVTGVALGTATITATSEGRAATAAITVVAVPVVPVATVAVAPVSMSLQVAQTGQFTATLRDAAGNALSGRAIVWSSTAPLIASVNATGQVTALLAGSATIRATSEGKIGSAAVTVGLVPVASVSVLPTSLNLQVGQTAQVAATLRDAIGNVLTGRAINWTTSSPVVATVSSSGLVTATGSGTATVSATSEGRVGNVSVFVASAPPGGGGGGVGNMAEPVYNAANPDHKLHVYENWSNLSSVANLFTSTRSDGGSPWKYHAGANTNPATYMTLVSQGDGFGSAKHVRIDFTSDPPIAPHGIGGPYTAAHTGFHWAQGGGDDNSLSLLRNTISSTTSNTLTDNSQSWPTNRFVGAGVDVYAATNCGGARIGSSTVQANTATTLTIAGTWNVTGAVCYLIGASGTARSWIRGFDIGTFLSRPVKSAVIYEFAVRHTGADWYSHGKLIDIGGATGGTGRFNYDPFAWNLGVGQPSSCNDQFCPLYYSNNGATPRFAGLPPRHNTSAPAFARSQSPDLSALIGSGGIIIYKQNKNWGTGAGQFAQGGKAGDGAARNADLTGTSKYMHEAGWLYTKIRLTKEPITVPYVYGRGRIEVWIGKSPGALVKVMEYVGDNANDPAFNRVWIDPTGSGLLPESVHIAAPTDRSYKGGAILDIGTFRVWSHTRQ